MSVSKTVRDKITCIEPGVIFGLKDFFEIENLQAVTLELSRLSKKGAIQRLKKGQYFVPKISRFGNLGPSERQILDRVIVESGGYLAGLSSLNRIGVTTQIPSEVTIRGARSTRQLKVGSLTINFSRQGNPTVAEKSSNLIDVIEAARLIKKTPDGNIQLTVDRISDFLADLKADELEQLKKMLLIERPYIRALLGAIMERNKISQAQELKASLNPLTKYKMGVKKLRLPNKKSWGIV